MQSNSLLNTISFPLSMDAYECIGEIKAKPFCEAFSEQMDAAESLYGLQLAIWFDIRDLDDLLSDISEYYPEEALERVSAVLRERLRRYSNLKIKQPLQEAIGEAQGKGRAELNTDKKHIQKR